MNIIVIGGGAAGFFAAINSAQMHENCNVTLLEKSSKLLSKVRVSGGGRCNVTHACFDITEMIKKYPRGANFVKKTFHQFFTTDTIQWFDERQVLLKTEPDGRMFPASNSSQTIVDCLMNEASRYNVEIRLNADVKSVRRETSGGKRETSVEESEPGPTNQENEKFILEIASTTNPASDI